MGVVRPDAEVIGPDKVIRESSLEPVLNRVAKVEVKAERRMDGVIVASMPAPRSTLNCWATPRRFSLKLS